MPNFFKSFLQRRGILSAVISATLCLKTYALLQYAKYAVACFFLGFIFGFASIS